MTVLGDRVLIKPADQSVYQTHTGIIVQEDYAPEVIGTVVTCREGLEVRPDDVVIFPPSVGRVVTYDGDRYLVVDADHILAVVE